MFFKGNETEILNEELFKNPTSEYRGAPFWAWNSSLDIPELEEQIRIFKEMGFGGFNMHTRQGLETPYLSDEFMGAVRACAECAEREDMYAWAYDEDRWPSGCAGGILTREKKHRVRYLLMTVNKIDGATEDPELELNEGAPRYFGSFKVEVDGFGSMTGYERAPHENATGVRHFYAMTRPGGEPRYNGETYADVLSRDTVDKFIDITHERYKSTVGEFFGGRIPAIFTDEPQTAINVYLPSGFSTANVQAPYTPGLIGVFEKRFGYSLADRLPELFFAAENAAAKKTRHDFFRLVSDTFMEAYIDNIGKWCDKNGIMLTGHALGEDTLFEQVRVGYESMRFYRGMKLPGIDCLCNDKAFTTAIQCRSVVNQMDKEGMLSEMYGLTGWDFDLRGHKYQGDWQACLGVSVRCHHLAWQTMKGEGKRDYPASIFYQSPWYLEYKHLEDHYSRLNTVLTRGRSAARVAVLHPLDTYSVLRASDAETKELSDEMEARFHDLAHTLITDMVDFDYISESLLPELCPKGDNPLAVGSMKYDLLIVADCETLREHTLRVLDEYKRAGGELLFIGNEPHMIEAVEDERAAALSLGCKKTSHAPSEIRRAIRAYKNVFLTERSGADTRDIIHTERIDGSRRHLFFARVETNPLPHIVNERDLSLRIRGLWLPRLRDTFKGEIVDIPFEHIDGDTVIGFKFYDNDSVLLTLYEYCGEESLKPGKNGEKLLPLPTPNVCSYKLSEPNVLLLDMPEYSINGGEMRGPEEIMRADEDIRRTLSLPTRKTKVIQPYAIAKAPEDHRLLLRYTVKSEIELDEVFLALENAEKSTVTLNGTEYGGVCGYYVDKHIKKIKLGRLVVGENVITVSMPFGERTDLEAMYLLGNFGTKCIGREPSVISPSETVAFGDLSVQGLRFYGGNITYESELVLEDESDVLIKAACYKGALLKISVDGGESSYATFSPYTVRVNGLAPGKHTVRYELFGNRYNTFSAAHTLLADKKRVYIGPDFWRSTGDGFAYEYQSRPFGILKAPEIYRVIKQY